MPHDNETGNGDIEDDYHSDISDLLMPALALACAPGKTSSWTHWPEWSKINSVTWDDDKCYDMEGIAQSHF